MIIPRFDKRIIAYIIDMIIPMGLSIFTYFGLLGKIYTFNLLSIFIWTEILTMFFFSLIGGLIAYLTNGSSLGNIIMQSKMVSLNEEKLTLRQCFLKYFPLSVIPLVLINAVYMLVVHTETTIFDTVSKTLVIIK